MNDNSYHGPLRATKNGRIECRIKYFGITMQSLVNLFHEPCHPSGHMATWFPGLPDDAEVMQCFYEPFRQMYIAMVWHETFPIVDEGRMPEALESATEIMPPKLEGPDWKDFQDMLDLLKAAAAHLKEWRKPTAEDLIRQIDRKLERHKP